MDTPFFGPFDVSRSPNFADNQLINLYPELVETKDGKRVGALFGVPGLTLATTLGSSPVRAVYTILGPQEAFYAFAGSTIYAIGGPPSYGATNIGTMSTSSGPLSIIDNGTSIAAFDGAHGYLIQVPANTVTSITLPFSGPSSAAYQDTFGFVSQGGSTTLWQSNSGDLSTWNSLNFANADASGDSIIALADIHRELWVFKTRTIEIWVDAGLNGFSFQRLDGVYIEAGCAAANSVAKAGESLIFLGRNSQGSAIVVMMRGYQALRVSTHAVESAIQGYSVFSDAIGYVYQQYGHTFYVLTFPTGNATWVYDVTASDLAGVPLWHQRQSISGGRHVGNSASLYLNQTMLGDFGSGAVYILDPSNLTDNGSLRTWTRSWRAMAQPTMQPQRFSSLQIDMMTGIGAVGSPNVFLSWSDDGGHTFSSSLSASAGASGATSHRVMFRRLGSTRRDTGLDRIFKLVSGDQYSVALLGAVLEP